MGTSELIKALKTQDLTETEAYNLIIADLFDAIPEADVAVAQNLVAYFMYKIQKVCFRAISDLRAGL